MSPTLSLYEELGGIQVYLGRLRTTGGDKVVAKRVRAIFVENQPGKLDEYDIFDGGGAFLTKLYICG